MFGRRRSGKQIAVSMLTGVGVVTILAVMVGTLSQDQLLVGTLAMTAIGLIGIWLFDSGRAWSWLSDLSSYVTIVGIVGFWDAFIDSIMSWVIALIFYWGLTTLVRRARYARMGS